jgi:membrane associated rhomboid family serine protease
MDEAPRCYRHPDRETYVSCSECGRPICEDCMNFAPVGIRCPEHASVGAPKRAGQRTIRQARARTGALAAPAVVGLVAANVIVYLITAAQGAGPNAPGGALFLDWALAGVAVADGEWYRLVTAMFLHGGLLHLAFNMLALWWLGSIVEQAIGTVRFLLVYFVSGLAGSAGALLLSNPLQITVGASGAIFGIMGALLILEYMATGSFAGQALTLIVINLALTFAIPNISVGGHLGGLAGGIAATYALTKLRYVRPAFLAPAAVVAIGAASLLVAYVRVESYVF